MRSNINGRLAVSLRALMTGPWNLRQQRDRLVQGHALARGMRDRRCFATSRSAAATRPVRGAESCSSSRPRDKMPWIVGHKRFVEILYLGKRSAAPTASRSRMDQPVVTARLAARRDAENMPKRLALISPRRWPPPSSAINRGIESAGFHQGLQSGLDWSPAIRGKHRGRAGSSMPSGKDGLKDRAKWATRPVLEGDLGEQAGAASLQADSGLNGLPG